MKRSRSWLNSVWRYLAIALVSCFIFTSVFTPSLRAAVQPIVIAPELDPGLNPGLDPEIDNVAPEHAVDEGGPLALRHGKQLYDSGRLIEAIDQWQTAAIEAEQAGDRPTQIRALRYRAMAHQALNQWSVAEAVLAEADAMLHHLAHTTESGLLQAQLKITQGNLLLGKGRTEEALGSFEQAEQFYGQIDDRDGWVLSRLNQAQALQALGFYPRARDLLTALSVELATEPDSRLKGRALRQLSTVLQTVGERERAEQMLAQSQTVFESLNIPSELAETLFQRGQIAQTQQQWQAAVRFYDLAQALTNQSNLRFESAAQTIRVALQNPLSRNQSQVSSDAIRLLAQLERLTPSRWRFYTQVHVAQSLLLQSRTNAVTEGRQRQPSSMDYVLARSLARAATQAHELQDARAESYLLGQLGTLYEQNERYGDALGFTRQALNLARQLNASDLQATWQWQTGRILKAEGEERDAIASYTAAVHQLQDLRQDLVATNPDAQFSFRDQVEPVYRQLVELLLTDVDALPAAEKQERLEQSRQTIEALQVAQVQNFLREACETYEMRPIEAIDTTAAVFYPIVLGDRLEVILSLSGQPLQHYTSAFPAAEQQELFRALRQTLNPAFPAELGLAPAQQLYDRLIRPSEPCLQTQGIETLVFVLDDFLRSLPMAVLHDGDRYLVEKYSLALTPGLQLTDSRPLKNQRFRLLAGGLQAARQGFEALPGVAQEINTVSTTFPNQLDSHVLLDQDFNRQQLLQQINQKPFSVVHLATHGQFSSRLEDTFLLTWSDRIGVQDLDVLLNPTSGLARSPVELMILSACQTAKGDRKATLGLAGMAVRSGARSTLATLWSVQDASTAVFIEAFYQHLFEQGLSRAQSLRQAQLSLLRSDYSHPYYWAPFVMVGNWQ